MSGTYTFKYLQHELKLLDVENAVFRNKVFSCGITAAVFLAHRLLTLKYKKYPKMIADDDTTGKHHLHKNYRYYSSCSVQTDDSYVHVDAISSHLEITTEEATPSISPLMEPLQMRLEELLGLLSNKEANICFLYEKINQLENIITQLEMQQIHVVGDSPPITFDSHLAVSVLPDQLSAKDHHGNSSRVNDTTVEQEVVVSRQDYESEITLLQEQLSKANYTLKLKETKISSLEAKIIMKEQHVRSVSSELTSVKAILGGIQDAYQTTLQKNEELRGLVESKENEVICLRQQLEHSQGVAEQQEELLNKIAVAMDCEWTTDHTDGEASQESRVKLEEVIIEHLTEKFSHLDELDTNFFHEMEELKNRLKVREDELLVKEDELNAKYQAKQMQLDKNEQDLITRIKMLQVREHNVDERLVEIENDMTLIQQWRFRLEEREKSVEDHLRLIEEHGKEKHNHYEATLKEVEIAYENRLMKETSALEQQVQLLQQEINDIRKLWYEQVDQYQQKIELLTEQLGSMKLSKIQEVTDLHRMMHNLRQDKSSTASSKQSSSLSPTPSISSDKSSSKTSTRDYGKDVDISFRTPDRSLSKSRSSTPNKAKLTRTPISKGSPSINGPFYMLTTTDQGKISIRNPHNPHDEVKMSQWSVADIPWTPDVTSQDYVRYYMNH